MNDPIRRPVDWTGVRAIHARINRARAERISEITALTERKTDSQANTSEFDGINPNEWKMK